MRAIDFACRLLLRIEQSPLPNEQIRILIALGAGLETCKDISRHCHLSTQQTSSQLHQLYQQKHLQRTQQKRNYNYTLNQSGKQQLAQLLNFISTN